MFTITKRFAFSASHVLDTLGPDHPCARLHGHNYEVEVVLARSELDAHGFVVDYGVLDAVKRFVDATLDHRHLNDVLPGPPSSEHLAWWLYEWAKGNLPAEAAAALSAVRVSETPRTWAEYRPGP
jgi:6-pyruvoyltetrahydropterin/6-carboxytetrahydropterin synthase